MEHDFWHERWQTGRIGFHRDAPNPFMVAHHEEVLAGARTIYVPLAGKTVDLRWLAERGHTVVASELSPLAIDAFFAEQGLTATTTPSDRGAHRVHRASVPAVRGDVVGEVVIFEGDAFDLRPEDLQSAIGRRDVDAVWDRAALIALHPDQRRGYQEALWRLLPVGAPILQVTFGYDQTKLDGPPWSVDADCLAGVYGDVADITHLASVAEPVGPAFQAAGVDDVQEHCFVVRRSR